MDSLLASSVEGVRSMKSTQTRRMAKGQPCLIRLPNCSGGGDDTVLCHYRLSGYSGTGLKPPDCMGAFGCMSCHSVVDGRSPIPEGYTRETVRLAHAEGCLRTQALIQGEVA